MAAKKTKGRQKIEMKRIENEDDRLITFSKRRSGIYKKASELATLCGAEVAFVVFSPSGKPYSFGHPSIESVANRFQGQNPPPGDNTQNLLEAHRQLRINELNQQHNQLLSQLEAEKDREKALKQLTKDKESQGWWEAPIEELNMQELQQMYAAFEDLHIKALNKIKERGAGASSSSLPAMNPAPGPNPFAPSASEIDPTTFPPGYGFGPGQMGAGASSSSLPAMNPAPGPNPFAPTATEIDSATFPPGYGFGPRQMGACSSSLPPMNPVPGPNPFATTSEIDPATFPHGYGFGPRQMDAGASSSSLPAMNPEPGPNPFAPNESEIDPATCPPDYGFGPRQL